MLVTLMTDASHCPRTGAGGFGYWCASERGKRPGGGSLNGVIKDSYEAEMKAVANALKASIDAGLVHENDTVLIQLDNLGVVNCISKKNNPREDVEHVLRYIFNYADKYHLKLISRHVKGHSRNTDQRSKANNHCDARAYEGMQQARKMLSG